MNALISRFFAFITFLFSYSAIANTVSIGIFTEFKISSFIISADKGDYSLYGDGKKIIEVKGIIPILCQSQGDSVLVKRQTTILGVFKNVRLIGQGAPNSFKIKPVNPEKPQRIYDHNLEVTSKAKILKIINKANLEYYVAGVVESENGIYQNEEYYKLKSIICRTYALNNLKRHEQEGFSLCDRVHCQVYKFKNRGNDTILKATLSTTGLVIVDSSYKLITAAFHSNCGGQTLNSEDVWSLPTSYLKSVKDTFCSEMPHAVWEHKIPEKDWLQYLKNHKMSEDPDHRDCFLHYHQHERETEFISHNVKIPLKLIRNDFKLKSTFFIFEKEEGAIVLKGKGFGHGIGLCQEGAMRMAALGYKYQEILNFYYQNIHVVDVSVPAFFNN
jgi:stage II sporulation protein D